MKNFGPYIKETIDFTCFEDSSLFLISGKTGSGKTTIFDGMSYALFGESSGKLRQGKEMRSTFADASEPTEVCFTFSHGEYCYEINRKPEQELYKKRGEGTRVQPAKISLIVKNQAGKELKEYTKRREVDQFIQELLHLDANQFAQIVLLPQGEFRTFLIANSDEKEKVLRNLFGTQLYQAVNEKLKIRLKETNKGIETTQQLIQAKMEQIYWETPVEELTVDQELDYLEIQQQQMVRQQQTKKERLEKLQEQKKNKEQEKYAEEQLVQQFEKKEKLMKQLQELEEQAEEIDQLKNELKLTEWALQQQRLIEKLDETEKIIQKCQQKESEYRKTQIELDDLLKKSNREQKENRKQENDIKAQKQQITQLQFQLPLYESYSELQQALNEKQNILTKVEKELHQQTSELEKYQQEQELLNKEIEKKAALERQQMILERQQEQWQVFLTEWQSQKLISKKIVELEEQVRLEKQRLQRKINATILIAEEVTAAKSQWARMQIGRLSLLLVDGEACPVCGALEHPFKEEHREYSIEEIQVSEALLDTKEKELQKLEEEKVTLQTTIIHLEKELLEKQADQKQQRKKITEILENKLSNLDYVNEIELTDGAVKEQNEWFSNQESANKEKLAMLAVKIETLELLEDTLKKQQIIVEKQTLLLQQLTQEKISLEGQLKTLLKQLVNPDVTLETLQRQIELLEQQVNDWEEEQTRLTKVLNELMEEQLLLDNTGKYNLEQLEEHEVAQQVLIADLKQTISKAPFEINEQQLRERLAQRDSIEQLKEKILAFEQEKSQLVYAFESIMEELKEKELPDLEIVIAEIDFLTKKIQTKEAIFYQLQEKITANQEIFKQVIELINTNQKKLEEASALQQLADTVNGNNPSKTSLERYVLQTYLEEVLKVANLRLGALTKNRYQFELNKTSGSYKNQTGLEINVYDDNAGTSRSAHTLSGGESFIAALALALSLAEVIQEQAGGVLIEALFIDEGFGSLDEEALEMAMEALETIENEGRMIGIISHVGELKARISQQLQIQTNGNGQSNVNYQLA
nr:SMC family ATPase [Enterococcus rivorum]